MVYWGMNDILMNDIIGNRYHKLVVTEYVGRGRTVRAGKNGHWEQYYKCTCDCGNTKLIIRRSLLSGNTKSCGCILRAKSNDPVSKQPEYKVWQGMKGRCNNPWHADWLNYGVRGIRVCEAWLDDYPQFIKDMGRRPKGLTIERIDNDKGYSPDNCKWITRAAQNLNKRNNNKCIGVTPIKNSRINNWQANGTIKKKQIYLGNHAEWWDAVCARKSWENRVGLF